ncbi:hypothetical protein ACFO5R_09925 [Halosolutus amylolyticus]|uniref:Uncharacterized protein n=1 Tax=Halosolutus amylolyticus TaxID=2932267 RepID=A0ABD5PNY1_9EURY|nr:hypothetical protein [Halosolutus amylolyticus]
MTNSPTAHDQRSAGSDESTDDTGETGALERIVPSMATPIRKTGFWAAIVMPFLYVPLLATGLSTSRETMVFLGLLAVNLVALYVGHAHRR